MDSSQSNNSGGERRLSTAASQRSSSNSHANSDESYHLEDITVADGFRPSNPVPDSTSSTSQSDSQPAAPQPLLLSPLSRIAPPSQPISFSPTEQTTSSSTPAPDITNKGNPGPAIPRPSSVSKPHRPHESLTLRNDGSSATIANSSTNSQDTNDSPLTQNESNSHPSSSLFGSSAEASRTGTTNSTRPLIERAYDGPRGPTHPYALYPQNTATSEELSNQHIPVGFPGHGMAYQRQLGPDGEEIGDLIGPLGHMEELPPYTRYPEQTYLRRDGAGASSATGPGSNGVSSMSAPGSNGASFVSAPERTSGSAPGSSSGSPQNAVPAAPLPVHPGAGGIGLATRDPEFSSTDGSLVVANSQGSIQSADTSNTSHGINIAARDFAEKLPMGKWQRRARKKLWGVIPYWALCLLVTGMVIVGIVLGAVVGTILTGDGGDGGLDYPYGEVPTPADVEPFSQLPENLTGLETGPWDLPPLRVGQSPNMCFNDTTQSEAWSCDLPLRWYSLSISEIPDADEVENYELTLTAVNGSDNMYLWGTQQPSISDPVKLALVNDSFQPSRGPAWWFKKNYNKVVIIPEDNLEGPKNQKRDWTYTGPPRPGFDPTRFMSKNPGPQDGEKPWFCTWPNTTMEVFIYPSQNISVRYTSTSSSSTSSLSTSPTSSAAPSETPLPSYDPTPAYPQVMKFMERRLFMDGDAEAATCQQVLIKNGGRDMEYLYNDDGHPIEVSIVERYRTYEELVEASERDRHPGDSSRRWLHNPFEKRHEPYVKREALELTDCGCLWWSS